MRSHIKTYGIYGSSLILIIIISLLVYQIVQVQKTDAARINLMGRQRMLTQKLSKEILLYADGKISKKEPQKTMDLFESSLKVLINGGNIPVDLKFQSYRLLPKMTHDDRKKEFLQINEKWQNFKSNALQFLENRNSTSLLFIVNRNVDMLIIIDQMVLYLQTVSEKNDKMIRSVLFAIVLSIIFFLFTALARKATQFKRASQHIRKLESIFPICSGCKKIRVENGNAKNQDSWQQLEEYLYQTRNMNFSHGLCPECVKSLYPDSHIFDDHSEINNQPRPDNESASDQNASTTVDHPAIVTSSNTPEEIEKAEGMDTVLLIEDEEMVSEVEQKMLEMIGYRVLTAKTGKEAIAFANNYDEDIDIALLDLGLPDMTGKEVYFKLINARPDLKVFICSGFNVHGHAQEILNAGARAFIQKPFAIKELYRTLKYNVERRKNDRFKVEGDVVITIPSSQHIVKYKIVDISMGGVSFLDNENFVFSRESSEIAIKIAGSNFFLENITGKMISDQAIENVVSLNHEKIKRISLQFSELNPSQTTQLEYLIQNQAA